MKEISIAMITVISIAMITAISIAMSMADKLVEFDGLDLSVWGQTESLDNQI